jgi:hypothetical protein
MVEPFFYHGRPIFPWFFHGRQSLLPALGEKCSLPIAPLPYFGQIMEYRRESAKEML